MASAKGGVGKTMTAFALASGAARGGARTVILNLDRLRTISYQMGLSANAAGVSEVDGARYLMDVAHQVAPCLRVTNGSETVDPLRLRAADVTALCQAAEDMGVLVIGAAPLTVVK